MNDNNEYGTEKESKIEKIKNFVKSKKKPDLTVKFSESYDKFQASIPAFL